MPFQLTISEGKEAGKELVFEQPSVMIGRTPECDIILYDPGVSRQHARIFLEGTAFFVEDMGSANGTTVNGAGVQKKTPLNEGDAISLGPVTFKFLPIAAPTPNERTVIRAVPAISDVHTRIVSAEDVEKTRKPKALPSGNEDDTDEERGLARASGSPAAVRRSSGPRPRGSGAGLDRASGPRISAAERARIRRESGGLGGTFRIFWADASSGARASVVIVIVLLSLGVLGGGGAFLFKDYLFPEHGPKHAEPERLAHAPIEDSFGVGPGVTFERSDKKGFYFDANSPSRTVAVLHFQSRDISQGEVAVTANGASLGLVPADTVAANEVSHEIFIGANLVKKAEKNQIVFDNLHNPPKNDTWRIWNVWIEVAPLPDLAIDQLVKQAQESFNRGQLLFERKNIGADSLFKGWKEFRNAWLMLEAHPDPKPETYELARDRMFEAQRALDAKCSQLMLEVQTYLSQKDWESARATLDQVSVYFPTKEQPCPLRASQLRDELEL